MQASVREENLNSEDLALSKQLRPFSYNSLRIEEGLRPIGFRFSKHIINIIANLNGREIIACGEAETRELAKTKAISELIERSALITNSEKYNTQTSNGWAAHPEKAQAKINATLELVERDAVLAQWYSSTPFLQIDSATLPIEIQNWASQELSRSEYPKLFLLLSTMGIGPSVTCILQNETGFGVSAHCTKSEIHQSVVGAITEACRAAHSSIRKEHWRSSLKLKTGASGLFDPSTHGVFYAYHEAFPEWMFGNNISWLDASAAWEARVNGVLIDTCFEFQSVMELPIHVGFAKHVSAFELIWASTDVEKVALSEGAKRLNLKSETINGKPHIVS